ncbi:hypothetical protein WN944_028367 [Citrus x changshan-huyou]|uniref:Uncharacterized protein n=1 Tax=Citrus x changshan-huyou TaxID=2935761 RepID=A0AAP0LJP1_9ROSI
MADVLRGGGVQCNEKCGCPGGLACKSVPTLRAQAKRRASMTTRSALVGNIAGSCNPCSCVKAQSSGAYKPFRRLHLHCMMHARAINHYETRYMHGCLA